ncbi:MAG: hypothetical protein ACK4N5_05750 [Myxococcales bacterium]
MRHLLAACLLVCWTVPALAQDFIPAPLVPPPAAKPKPQPKKAEADEDFMPTLLPGTPAAPASKPAAKKPPATKAAPLPTKLAITGPTEPIKAEQRVNLNITVTDAAGETVAAQIKITSDYGIVTPPIEMDPGEFMCTFVAPAKLPEGGTAIVKATVTSPATPKPVAAQVVLTFVKPPPPAVAKVEPKKEPKPEPKAPPKQPLIATDLGGTPAGKPVRVVFADDKLAIRPGQTATVRFKVEDENGQPVPADAVSLKSPNGTFGAIRSEGGMYVADYSPAPDQRGELRVFAESNGEGLLGDTMVLVEKPGLIAEENRIGLDVSGYAGGLTNFGKMATPSFELAVDYHVTEAIRAGVLGGLSPTSATVTSGRPGQPTPPNARTAEFSLAIIPVLARAAYVQTVGPVDVYAGGAVGAAFVSGTIKTAASTKDFSTLAPQFGAFAGAGLPLGPGVALVEVRMSHAAIKFEDATTTVTGNVGGLSGALGYKLEL